MIILKILYICWVIFLTLLWFLFLAIGHNPDLFEAFLELVGVAIAPLWVYNLWLFGIKRDRKYFRNFLILLCYYPLGYVIYSICYFGFEGFFNKTLFFIYKALIGD